MICCRAFRSLYSFPTKLYHFFYRIQRCGVIYNFRFHKLLSFVRVYVYRSGNRREIITLGGRRGKLKGVRGGVDARVFRLAYKFISIGSRVL